MSNNESIPSIIYANDKDDNLIHANDAIKGEKYYCMFCGIKLYRKCLDGRAFFCRIPHELHSSNICKNIEKTGKCPSLSCSTPESLMTSFCRTPTPRLTSNSTAYESVTRNASPQAVSAPVFREVPFASVKQMFEFGVLSKAPTEIIGESYTISDFFMDYRSIHLLMDSSSFILGARTLRLKYNNYKRESGEIYASLFTRNAQVQFIISISDGTLFNDFLKQIYASEFNPLTKKKESIQIAKEFFFASDDWRFITNCHNKCKFSGSTNCNKCFGLYKACYNNKKQLYVLPM